MNYVDPEELRSLCTEALKLINNYENQVQQLSRYAETDLSNAWDGETYESFKVSYTPARQKLDVIQEELTSFNTFLQKTADDASALISDMNRRNSQGY